MKLLISAALTAATLLAFAAPAQATPVIEECQQSPSYDAPSGTYVAPDGRKWAGFHQDGTPPESLATGNGEQTCKKWH